MDHLTSEDAHRLQEYLERHGIQVDNALGSGTDGSVWSTSRRTALKLHRNSRRYQQERNVYLRLKQKRLHRLAGFSIPIPL
ncbi:MAG: hypothetical protein ACF8TS_17820 [Maioricimonas sp. JB049]